MKKEYTDIILIFVLSILLGTSRYTFMDKYDFIKRPIEKISCENLDDFMTEPQSVDTECLSYMVSKNMCIVIDARDVTDYDSGHILGAINVPFDYYEEYDEEINSLNFETPVVTYCNGEECSLSIDLAEYLFNDIGIDKVYVYEEGFPIWKDRGLPINSFVENSNE